MRNGSPEDIIIKKLMKRVGMLESAVSSLFEILLKSGVISEASCQSRDSGPPSKPAPNKKPTRGKSARRRCSSPNKETRDETRRGIEFLIFTTRGPEKPKDK